jgi:hypothetical protein
MNFINKTKDLLGTASMHLTIDAYATSRQASVSYQPSLILPAAMIKLLFDSWPTLSAK